MQTPRPRPMLLSLSILQDPMQTWASWNTLEILAGGKLRQGVTSLKTGLSHTVRSFYNSLPIQTEVLLCSRNNLLFLDHTTKGKIFPF